MKLSFSGWLSRLGVDKDHLRQIYWLVRPHWKRLLLSVLCMIGVGWAVAGTAYLIKPVLDKIFVNKDETMLKILPIAVLVLVTGQGIVSLGKCLSYRLYRPIRCSRTAQEAARSYTDAPLVFF